MSLPELSNQITKIISLTFLTITTVSIIYDSVNIFTKMLLILDYKTYLPVNNQRSNGFSLYCWMAYQ